MLVLGWLTILLAMIYLVVSVLIIEGVCCVPFFSRACFFQQLEELVAGSCCCDSSGESRIVALER